MNPSCGVDTVPGPGHTIQWVSQEIAAQERYLSCGGTRLCTSGSTQGQEKGRAELAPACHISGFPGSYFSPKAEEQRRPDPCQEEEPPGSQGSQEQNLVLTV